MNNEIKKLYDINPIEKFDYVMEEYIGYGINQLPKLTDAELDELLKKAEKDLENLNNELSNADDEFPVYGIKESIKNIEYDIKKIHEEKDARKYRKDTKEHIKESVTDKHVFKSFNSKITDYL